MDRESFYRETAELLGRINSRPGQPVVPAAVAEDANLFDEGLLTSLTVVQVMAYIEEQTASRIAPTRYGIEDFSSLRKLYQVFDRQRSDAGVA